MGGSFDPIHFGHLDLAQAAFKELVLDKFYLVLTPTSPFKLDKKETQLFDRLQMLKMAQKKFPNLRIARWELKRKGPSYTVQTLMDYRKTHPRDEIYFVMGSDAWKNFSSWRKPNQILSLAHIVVGKRPGALKVSSHLDYRPLVLKGKFPNISSTQIRLNVKQKKSLLPLVPESVARYIESKKLYV